MNASVSAQQRLDEATANFVAEAKSLYDRPDLLEILPRMLVRGAQDRLFNEVTGALGFDGFATPISYLEVGCGTSTFLLSVLERGHNGYGVDLGRASLALARAKIESFQLPHDWNDRIIEGDASATPFESNSFDLVIGHQFIEHVDHVPATLREMVRVTKPGGYIVLWAPDYRAPFEPHYMLPWPVFPTRPMAECWVDCFERPHKGLDSFNYVTLPQLIAIAQLLGCDVVRAWNDRQFDPSAYLHFQTSSLTGLRETAKRFKEMMELGTLPANFQGATSLGMTLRKR